MNSPSISTVIVALVREKLQAHFFHFLPIIYMNLLTDFFIKQHESAPFQRLHFKLGMFDAGAYPALTFWWG